MEIHIELLNEKMREIVADRERSYSRQFAEASKQVVKSFKSIEKAARNLEEATKRAWGASLGPPNCMESDFQSWCSKLASR